MHVYTLPSLAHLNPSPRELEADLNEIGIGLEGLMGTGLGMGLGV